MEEQRTRRCLRVVLVTLPFQGHISPFLELGTALHSKGFSITIAHPKFNAPDPSSHPHLMFLPLFDGLTDSDISSGDLVAFVTTVNTNCEAPLEESLAQMIDREEEHGQVTCIIYDALFYAADVVANHLKLPSIVFHTCSATALPAFGFLAQFQQAGYFSLPDSKSQDLVPGHHPLRYKDIPISKFTSIESLLKLTAIMCDVRTSSGIVFNSIDWLEHPALEELQQQHQIPCFPVGPLFKIASASSGSLLEEDINCIKWLNKQSPNSVLYISLGSVVSIDEKELVEMAWGLANCGQPFLWVIRPGSVRGSKWIELLPKGLEDVIAVRGLIVKWAPQKEILAHESVGGFWSHCGWNSTLESISEGVPMICSPGFGDQKVNARYVSHVWKVGLELDGGLERGKIEKMVKRLMVNKEVEEVRKRATDFKEKVELCISEGGSSYNSLNDLVEYISSLSGAECGFTFYSF